MGRQRGVHEWDGSVVSLGNLFAQLLCRQVGLFQTQHGEYPIRLLQVFQCMGQGAGVAGVCEIPLQASFNVLQYLSEFADKTCHGALSGAMVKDRQHPIVKGLGISALARLA